MKAAKIENNIVIQIIEGSAEWANSRLGGDWVHIEDDSTAIGYSFNPESKRFTAPQPYPSWI